MAVSLFMLVYLLIFKPMESPFANRMEIMNEYTIVVLTYGQMHLSDYIPKPETRESFGYAYIGVFLLNIAVHMLFLIWDTCIKIKFACKRFENWFRYKRRIISIWWRLRKQINVKFANVLP